MAVTVAEGVKSIPDEVSHVLACNCRAIEPCKWGNRSCKSLKISYTEFVHAMLMHAIMNGLQTKLFSMNLNLMLKKPNSL